MTSRSSNLFFQRYAQLLPLFGEDLTGNRRIARPAEARAVLARYQKAQPYLARIDLLATDGALVASLGVVGTSYAARIASTRQCVRRSPTRLVLTAFS